MGYGDFSIFQDGGHRHLGFLKLETFNGQRLKRAELRRHAKFGRNRSKRGRRYGDFSIFQDGGRRHLEFLKFQTVNSGAPQEGRTASPCQIRSKLVKPQPRYADF